MRSPLYSAVRLCAPSANVESVRDAAPPLTATVLSNVTPSKNFTVPVAVRDESIAVRVSGWAGGAGFIEVRSETMACDLRTAGFRPKAPRPTVGAAGAFHTGSAIWAPALSSGLPG